jgi:hypothetical protein
VRPPAGPLAPKCNARKALDHVLARLKDRFGGDSRSGTFPITESDADWKGRIYPRRDGKRQRGPLDGLPCAARMLMVAPEGVKTKNQLGGWVARGVGFAGTLPPKG